MKKILLITLLIVIPALAGASVPRTLHFTGLLVTKQGDPIVDAVDVRFRLYSEPTGGTSLWEETHTGLIPEEGVVNRVLGVDREIPVSIFSADTLYIGVKVGQSQEMLPRYQISSVPYAFLSDSAQTLEGLTDQTCSADQVIMRNQANTGWVCTTESGGTVTSVGTGAGLTGGPVTSTGTLSIAQGGVLPTMLASCTSPGQVLKWGGSVWACAADEDTKNFATADQNCTDPTGQKVTGITAIGQLVCTADKDSGGTVTSVATGSGLTGGPVTGMGTISIAPGGVGSTHLTADQAGLVKVSGGAMVANNGKVGVGVAVPQSPLDVNGDIRISAGSGGQLVFADGTTMSSAGTGSANSLSNATDAIMSGDSDANGSGRVLLKTGSNNRVTVLNNGNVGVGEEAPASRLAVKGQEAFQGTGTITSSGTTVTGSGTQFSTELQVGDTLSVGNQEKVIVSIGANTALETQSAFDPPITYPVNFSFLQPTLRVKDKDGNPSLVVNSKGGAGIGAPSPAIWEPSYASLQLGQYGILASSNTGYTVIGNNYYKNLDGHRHIVSGRASYYRQYGGEHQFIVDSTNPGPNGVMSRTQAMTIDKIGNVGLGTPTPVSSLHIQRKEGGVTIIYDTANNDLGGSWAQWRRSRGSVESRTKLQNGDNIGTISFMGYDGNSHKQAAKIRAFVDGEPGEGSSDMPGRIAFYTTADDSDSCVERMTIRQNGKIGIGTTDPQQPLHINKSANSSTRMRFENNEGFMDVGVDAGKFAVFRADGTQVLRVDTGGNGSFTGNITSGNCQCSSDRRYKRDITTIRDALDKVSRLRGIRYYWKDSERGKEREIGVVAQEAEEVVPEVVHTNEKGYKSVRYGKLTAVLIEAVKEQQKQIKSQKEQLRILQQKVAALGRK